MGRAGKHGMAEQATLLRRLADERRLTYEDFNRLYKRVAEELYVETDDPILRGAEVAEMTYR